MRRWTHVRPARKIVEVKQVMVTKYLSEPIKSTSPVIEIRIDFKLAIFFSILAVETKVRILLIFSG